MPSVLISNTRTNVNQYWVNIADKWSKLDCMQVYWNKESPLTLKEENRGCPVAPRGSNFCRCHIRLGFPYLQLKSAGRDKKCCSPTNLNECYRWNSHPMRAMIKHARFVRRRSWIRVYFSLHYLFYFTIYDYTSHHGSYFFIAFQRLSHNLEWIIPSQQTHDVYSTSLQRRCNVMSWRCIDVETTLYKRHWLAGLRLKRTYKNSYIF